jgi:[glutamine synthetase] adenylyltransferase / [glutamine synthetase]-adenylyl-L-tyrosine phosphorylase
MLTDTQKLLTKDALDAAAVERLLTAAGVSDWQRAHKRLLGICTDDAGRAALAECLPMLLGALSEAATPDGSLINFERFVQSVPSRTELFRYLAANPRAVEILIKLFVGSQFLTEILLRNPNYLEQLTRHKRLAEIKSREQFVQEGGETIAAAVSVADKFDALRRFQRWELLRIGACDSFGLMDLKTVTVQLSLLADSLVRLCLMVLADDLQIAPEGFAVIAFGKLGGEELNYSSDIDLVFVARKDSTKFWPLGQRLIKALQESTGEGFLYRVDMRLRPWGRSGPLVSSIDAYADYLKKHGRLWEKQALLKARVIAGDATVGTELLKRAEPIVFNSPVDLVRKNVFEMKARIEAELLRQGRKWGEVKSGTGSIRDIEFITQFLQLSHGGTNPEVRSFNTLDALVRLADFGFLQANEYRQLSNGYMFLRTIEHALQLMHYKQIHNMPEDRRELAYLARRLDFPDPGLFLSYYQQHCRAVRAIFDKYIGGNGDAIDEIADTPVDRLAEHIARMEPSYAETFSQADIEHHAALLDRLSSENIVEIDARPIEGELWKLTVAGFDQVGDLSMICGLLFVYGFDIVAGDIFSDRHASGWSLRRSGGQEGDGRVGDGEQPTRRFVDVLTVKPPADMVVSDVWPRYKADLAGLLEQLQSGRAREAQGELARRVGGALHAVSGDDTPLCPVEIEIDNEASDVYTVLHIQAEDTTGFLYELSNALALSGIDVVRVTVSSVGKRVFDSLYVTDTEGNKIDDANRLRELRSAVVLIKHFTHLLPRSPNPESALLHFRDFLVQLFEHPNWIEELASLERPDVLEALAKLLGVSDFLWEDFLRLQHTNLFPVVKDVESLAERKTKEQLQAEMNAELDHAADLSERRAKLNAFKDREMFRIDMRHILDHVAEFGKFSEELTDVAEVVVEAACRICAEKLQARFGVPQFDDEGPCALSVCALGKCGGRELGFASDIELMFVYQGSGQTTGPEVVTTTEYYMKLVECFTHSIAAKREGIFEVDLRLRPYGKAGSLAVSFDAFRQYFAPDGAAWPYERQALVKLRPIAGDRKFGEEIVRLRDELVYTGEPFDVSAMRAMREKQVRQLVKAGTINAKLGPGGLVDCEYLVQGLQITHGQSDPSLRVPRTRDALAALERAGILSPQDHSRLSEAYIFQRRLIDALRMVRGHARDLTVPRADTEEFAFLARRLGYKNDLAQLQNDLERHIRTIQEMSRLLDNSN